VLAAGTASANGLVSSAGASLTQNGLLDLKGSFCNNHV
jgi:hypothetical protein